MNESRNSIQLRNFRDKVILFDSTYEWLIILITIFQAGILQYVMWLWRPVEILEYIIITKLLIILILPFAFSLFSWIFGYINNHIDWSFRYKLFSWGTIYLCIFINLSTLYHYIFNQFTINAKEMIDYKVYPLVDRTPFIFLTIFLTVLLSSIPTYILYLYNKTTLEYKNLNNVLNMIISPSMGMLIPFLIMIFMDYWMFPKITPF